MGKPMSGMDHMWAFRLTLRGQHEEHGKTLENLLTRCQNTVNQRTRLELALLRRMAERAESMPERALAYACKVRDNNERKNERLEPRIIRYHKAARKFREACLARIEEIHSYQRQG